MPGLRRASKHPLSKTSENSLKADFTSLDKARESGQTYLSYASIFPGANSKVEFKKKLKADNDKDVEDPMQPKFDRLSLLLSPQDMYEHNYPSPVPGSPGYQDPEFVFTHENYSEVWIMFDISIYS
ncbi:uncharacterized protein LOC121877908 [Homarus americanus]|uniref:uncharacterized protein LOC121877908 n=1 Tax=Homarus americanus TaxID=6706 RepID=UPI001C486178|nr:uncharacterized protein LOC121877908 [Homarus americanus]